jgi:hypothetical protein
MSATAPNVPLTCEQLGALCGLDACVLAFPELHIVDFDRPVEFTLEKLRQFLASSPP